MTNERPLDERPAAIPTTASSASDNFSKIPNTQRKFPHDYEGLGCFAIGCGPFIVIFIILLIIGSVQSSSPSSKQYEKEQLAIVTCQKLVKKNLKSPSSAHFIGVPKYSGGKILGQIDAENSFGASLRNSFQCTDLGDTVRLDYLR